MCSNLIGSQCSILTPSTLHTYIHVHVHVYMYMVVHVHMYYMYVMLHLTIHFPLCSCRHRLHSFPPSHSGWLTSRICSVPFARNKRVWQVHRLVWKWVWKQTCRVVQLVYIRPLTSPCVLTTLRLWGKQPIETCSNSFTTRSNPLLVSSRVVV